MSENEKAQWSISLDCDCPKCRETFGLMDDPDFWHGEIKQAGEHGTKASKDYEVTCPECGHEFKVDFEY